MTYQQYKDYFEEEVGEIYKYGGTYRFKTYNGKTTRKYNTEAIAKRERTKYINRLSKMMVDYDAETEEMARGKESMTYDEIGSKGYQDLYKNAAGRKALSDSDNLDPEDSNCCLVWMFDGFKEGGSSAFNVNMCEKRDPDKDFKDSISINKVLARSNYEARYFPLHDEWRIMPV